MAILASLFAAILLVGLQSLTHAAFWADFGLVILTRERRMFCELFLAFRTALKLENLIGQSFWQCL